MDTLTKILGTFPALKSLVRYGSRPNGAPASGGRETAVVLDGAVYTEEPILPPPERRAADLPPALARARELEEGRLWEARQETFLKQGRLLADYEDNCPYMGDPVRYYPTYQSLTDQELRGYFTWRPKIRTGVAEPAPATFVFLYIYELINLIGVATPEAAYERLLFVRRACASCSPAVKSYLDRWIPDFVIYYNLPPSLLSDSPETLYNQCVNVLANVGEEPRDRVVEAVRQLAPKWLSRSRFYAARFEEMDEVIHEVLKGMAAHYAKSCKRGLVDQVFGALMPRHAHLFSQAVFADPWQRRQYRYVLDSQRVYTCENGIWSASRRPVSGRSGRRLETLVKTIDQIMREECAFGHPLQADASPRWLTSLIREKTRELLDRKAEAEKRRVRIDFSLLGKIRSDAAITRERLAVEEEEDAAPPAAPPEASPRAAREPQAGSLPLTPLEARLLGCLLQGEDTAWLREEGHMLSVLADAINDKLYDVFGDTVLDGEGRPVEEYIDELKEMLSR